MVKVQSNAYIEAERREAVDELVEDDTTKWTSRSDFVDEAVAEKLEREGGVEE